MKDSYLGDTLRGILKEFSADAVQVSSLLGDYLVLLHSEGFDSDWIEEESLRERNECLCGWTLNNGELLLVDILEDGRVERSACPKAGMRSFIGVPIKSDGKVLGMISVYSMRRGAFNGDHLKRLKEIADELSNYLRRRLEEDERESLKERLRLIEYLADVAMKGGENLLDIAGKYLSSFFDTDFLIVFRVEDGNIDVLKVVGDTENRKLRKLEEWVRTNWRKLRRFFEGEVELVTRRNGKSILYALVRENGRFIGAYLVARRGTFTDDDATFLKTLLKLFSVYAVKNEAIRKHKIWEERYRALLDFSNDLIWFRDSKTNRVIFANKKVVEILGYSLKELKAAAAPEFVHPEDREKAMEVIERLNRGERLTYNIKLLKKKGGYVYLQVTAVPFVKNGEVVGNMSFAKNITVEEKLKEEVTHRLVELETLFDLAEILRRAQSVDDVCPLILKKLIEATGADTGILYLVDREDGVLIPHVAHGPINQMMRKKLPLKEGTYFGSIMQSGSLDTIRDLREFPYAPREMREFLKGPAGGIVLPIKTETSAIGLALFAFFRPLNISRERLSLISTIADMAANALERAILYEDLVKYAETLKSTYESVLITLAKALDYREHYTELHSERVAHLSVEVAKEMGVPEDKLEEIRWGALLHDIGKIGIPDHILLKPGKLDEFEWQIMKQHPVLGYELLKNINFLGGALDIVLYHHERYDGKGYPKGLKGDKIPLSARIFAVVDAYDAMTSDRPYRKAMSHEEAIEEIKRCSGTQFDPKVVDAFLKVIERVREKEAKS